MSAENIVQDSPTGIVPEEEREPLSGGWLTKVKDFLWGAPRTSPRPVWRPLADSLAQQKRNKEIQRARDWTDKASKTELVPADLEKKRVDAEDPAMQRHARAIAAVPKKGGLFLRVPVSAKGQLTDLVARRYGMPPEWAAQMFPVLRRRLIDDEQLDLDNISDEGLALHLQGVNQLEDSVARLALDAGMEGVPWDKAYVAIKPSIDRNKFYGEKRGREYQAMFQRVHAGSARLSAAVRPDVEKVVAAFENSESDPDFEQLMSHFRGKSNEQLGMMWQMLNKHKFVTRDKDFAVQSGQAVGRSFRDLYKGISRTAKRWDLEEIGRKVYPGKELPEELVARGPQGIFDYLELENETDAIESFSESRFLPQTVDLYFPGSKKKPLTEQDVAAVQDVLKARRGDTVLDAKLQRFADESVDPIKGANWFTEYLYYPALKSSAYTAASMLPYGVGLPFVYAANVDTEYNRLIESGVSHDVAMADSPWVGAIQTGVDRVQALFGLGKVPKLGRVRLPTLTASGVARQWTKDVFLITAVETGTEQTQQYLIPALRDSIRKDNGDVDWLGEDGPLVQAFATAPRTAGAVLLLGMLGSTKKQLNDVGAAREFLQSKHSLMQLRYSEEQAGEISSLAATDLKLSIEKARALWGQRAGTVETAAAAGRVAQRQMEGEARGVAELEASGVLPRIQTTNRGSYSLLLPEGGELEFTTYEEANAQRWNLPEVRRWEIHDSLREAIANSERTLKAGESRQFILRGAEEAMTADRRLAEMPENTPQERVAKDKLRQTLVERVETDQVVDGPTAEMEAYREGAAMNTVAKDAETGRIAAIILGESVTEFKQGVWLNTVKLYRGANAATVVEETLESNASRILRTEGGSRWMLKAVRDAEQALGSPLLRTRNDAEVTAGDLKEAFSAVGVGMFMDEASTGNERLKTNARWLSEEHRRLIGGTRLGLVYDAFARKMQAAFRRAEGLGKLRQEGQLDARLEEELAKALGIDPKGSEGAGEGAGHIRAADAQAMQSAEAADSGRAAEADQSAGGLSGAANGNAEAGVGTAAVPGAGVQPRLSFSRNSGARGLVDRFVNLAALEGRFRRGGPFQSPEPAVDPAVDMEPAVKLEQRLKDIVAHHALTPDEATVKRQSPMKPEISDSFHIALKAGGEAVINVQDGNVWVDTQGVWGGGTDSQSSSAPQQDENGNPMVKERELRGGDLVYQAALTYAHDNGLKFAPDPREISEKAKRRRISHMASSALRYGTTKHINPVFGKSRDSVAARWREETTSADYEHNLELLLREEMKWVTEEMANMPAHRAARYKREDTDYKLKVKEAARKGEPVPAPPARPTTEKEIVTLEDLHYDTESDTVLQKQKGPNGSVHWKRLSQGDFETLVAGLEPRDSGISAATLSRALVAKSEVEGQGVGSRGPEHLLPKGSDGRGEISEDPSSPLFHLLGTDAKPKELFYSQRQGNNLEGAAAGSRPVQRTGVTQAEVDEALAGLSTLPEATGLTDNLLIVGNRHELDGKDGRPGQADYHADEWAGIETAEGFIDTKTGGAVVLRDQVEVREGETPAVAVARVVMHERVGHGGVNALLRTEPKFQKKWDRASALIPAAELQSLRQKYPELADRPADLALEWLAHQTGDRLSSQSLKPGSTAAEMWQTLKDYVAKIMHAASGGRMMSDAALDAYVRDMIAGARRKVKNGEAGGSGAAASGVGNSSSNLKNETAPRLGEVDGSSLDEASAEPRLQFSKPKNPKVTPISTGTLQSSLEDVADPVLLEKLEAENQAKFDEVREAKGGLKSPDDVAERNREQKAFVDQFYNKAAYDAIMKDQHGDVVFLAMPSSSGNNRIPFYLAKKLSNDFGGTVLDGSNYFYRPDNEESKKNTTYLAKMAMQDFEVDDAAWKDDVKGKRVVLVDDIITSGDSLDTIAQKLKREGVEVEKAVSLVAHNSGRGIQLGTAVQLMERLNSQLAGHPVQGNPILNKALGSTDEQKKTLLNWIVGAHGKSREALLKKALVDANDPEGALSVLKALRKRYNKLQVKE